MILPLIIILTVMVVIFVLFIAWQPNAFRITRTALIPTPASTLFAQVNDFHRWEAWSPWAQLDPAAINSYAGSPSGEGARFHWAGNKKVGEGSMLLLESRANDFIRIQLDFLKPFRATNLSEFIFETIDNQTRVTWSMTGKNNFMAKAFGLMMNFDKMIGAQFEKGLANLKAVTQATTLR